MQLFSKHLLAIAFLVFACLTQSGLAHERTGIAPVGEAAINTLADVLAERAADPDYSPPFTGTEAMDAAVLSVAAREQAITTPPIHITRLIRAYEMLRDGKVDAEGHLLDPDAGWGTYNEIADEDFAAVAARMEAFRAFEARLIDADFEDSLIDETGEEGQ